MSLPKTTGGNAPVAGFAMSASRHLCLFLPLALVLAQQTLKLSNTLTIEKTDDKVKTHSDVVRLLNFAKEQKLESNVQRFLDNAVGQLEKMLEASKVYEQQKLCRSTLGVPRLRSTG